MDQKQIDLLTEKIADKTISDEELKLYYDWLASDDLQPLQISTAATKEELQKRIFSNIAERAGFHVINRKRVKLWPRIVAAAVIALVLFGTALWYAGNRGKDKEVQEFVDVRPGKNGATLTLANGQKIYISDNKAGKLAEETGVSISKTAEGQIVYTILDNAIAGNGMNTLQTSNGEQTQVRLPDGTVVYLNSASTLTYPSSFAKLEKRKVALSGEGYFKVSKDKAHPFIVKTARQDVEVLGTEFNVNSYADEPAIATTLLEGSIKITGNNRITKILKPNQQAINSEKGIIVNDVEAKFFIDWKEGFFMFNNEDMESIMKRVSRWYNVKVVFENASLKDKTFEGVISRYDNISSVIRILEGTGLAQFKMNNGVLTIKEKPKAD